MRIVPLMVLVAACGGTPAPKYPTPVDAENQVRSLENEWVQLEMKRDAAGLATVLDDHFTATFGGNPPMDKAAFIAEIGKDTEGWTQALSEQHVTIDGDVATTTGLNTVTPPGQTGHQVRYTSVYVYRDGHWRAFAFHISPVRPPAPPAPPPDANAPPTAAPTLEQ